MGTDPNSIRSSLANLPSHPQPINKAAALHTSGGERTGREELIWEQNGVYHGIMNRVVETSYGDIRGELKDHALLYDAIRRLATLKPGTFYYEDYKRHIKKLWKRTHCQANPKRRNMRFNAALKRAREKYEGAV